MPRVLIVDDEPTLLQQTAESVRALGFTAVTVESGDQAVRMLRADQRFTAVLVDLVMPDRDGFGVVDAMRREAIGVPVIALTDAHQTGLAASLLAQGFLDFCDKPVCADRLAMALAQAQRARFAAHARAGDGAGFDQPMSLDDFIGAHESLDRLRQQCQRAARVALPVLIEGEPGTGKERLARIIAETGERAGKPFVMVPCAHLPPREAEAILFGRQGAQMPGLMRAAQSGTLYLDEVSELPPAVQQKLLTTIADGEIVPVGASRPERINVRVIASSSRRLMHVVRDGGFREDLYYRLHVHSLYVPPLRERREDIGLLADHFVARFAPEAGKPVLGLSPEALSLIECYDWPRNVEQLEHAVLRAVALTEAGLLQPEDFPQVQAQVIGHAAARDAVPVPPPTETAQHIDLAGPRRRVETSAAHRFLDEEGGMLPLVALERQLIAFAIEHHHGRMSRVARALGIGRSTLYRKLREYGLDESVGSERAGDVAA